MYHIVDWVRYAVAAMLIVHADISASLYRKFLSAKIAIINNYQLGFWKCDHIKRWSFLKVATLAGVTVVILSIVH